MWSKEVPNNEGYYWYYDTENKVLDICYIFAGFNEDHRKQMLVVFMGDSVIYDRSKVTLDFIFNHVSIFTPDLSEVMNVDR